jgi:hypothetical protein
MDLLDMDHRILVETGAASYVCVHGFHGFPPPSMSFRARARNRAQKLQRIPILFILSKKTTLQQVCDSMASQCAVPEPERRESWQCNAQSCQSCQSCQKNR